MLKRTKIIIASTIGVILLSVGGVFAYSLLSGDGGTSDVTNVDDPRLVNRYDNKKSGDSVSSSDLSDESDLKEILYVTNGEFHRAKHVAGKASGDVKANVGAIPYNQTVVSRRVKNDEDIFFETTSLSAFVKTSEQRYTNSNSWLIRKGANPSESGADYSSSKVLVLSKEAYMDQYGQTSQDICNYVINDYSYVSGKFDGKEGELYSFTYVLNTEISCEKYKREVKYMSGSASYPVFNVSELTIRIDDNYKIHSMTVHDNYSISMIGMNLTCDSYLSEEYTYSDSYIEVEEKAYFEPYFGMTGGNVTKEKGALDYLGEAFTPLLSKEVVNAEIKTKVNDKPLDVYLSLDMKTFNTQVSINDAIDLKYVGNNVFVSTSEACFLVSKEELSALFELYDLSSLTGGIDVSSLLTNPMVSEIMSSMVVDKGDDYVTITIPLDIGDANINLNRKEDDSVTLKSIDGSIVYEGLDVDFDIALKEEAHKFRDIPTEVKEFKNLASLASKVNDVVASQGIEGKIDFEKSIGNYLVSLKGNYQAEFKEQTLYRIDLEIGLNNDSLSILVEGTKEELYLYFDSSFVVKTTFEELSSFIASIVNKDGSQLEQDFLSNFINDLDVTFIIDILQEILNAIETGDDKITVNLDLIKYDLGTFVIDLNYKDDLQLCLVDYGSITIKPVSSSLIISTCENYVGIDQIKKVYSSIIDLMGGEYVLDIESLSYLDFDISGQIKVDASSLNVEGQLVVKYHEYTINLSFAYIDYVAYVELNDNVKLMLSNDDIESLISRFSPSSENSGIDLSSLDLPIIEILKTLNLDEKGNLSLSIDTSFIGLEDVFKISLSDSKVFIDSNIIHAQLRPEDVNITSREDTSKYVKIDDVNKLIDSVFNLIDHLEKGQLDFVVSTSIIYQELKYDIELNVSVNFKDKLMFLVTTEFELNGIKLDIKLAFDYYNFFLDVNNAKFKLSYEAGIDLIELLGSEFGLDTSLVVSVLREKPLMRASESIDISSLIKSLSFAEEGMKLTLNLSEIESSLGDFDIYLNIDEHSNITSIVGSGLKIDEVFVIKPSIEINYSAEELDLSRFTNDNNYLDLSSIKNIDQAFVTSIKELMDTKLFELYDSTIVLSDELSITINKINVDITNYVIPNDLSSIESIIDGLKLSLSCVVYYRSSVYDIQLIVDEVNSITTIQLDIDSITNKILAFRGSVADLLDVVDYAASKFGFEVPALVSGNNESISLSQVVDLLSKLNSIVLGLEVSELGVATINLDLNEFGFDYSAKVTFDVLNKDIKVQVGSISTLVAAKVNVKATTDSPINIDINSSALTKTQFVAYIDEVYSIINDEVKHKFSGTLDTSFDLSLDGVSFMTPKLVIDYQIDLSDKFDAYLNIAFDVEGIKGTVIVVKKGDVIYLKLSEVVSRLTVDEFEEVISMFIVELLGDAKAAEINPQVKNVFDVLRDLNTGLKKYVDSFTSSNSTTNELEANGFDINSMLSLIDFDTILDNLTLSDEVIKVGFNVDKLLDNFGVGMTFDLLSIEYDKASSFISLSNEFGKASTDISLISYYGDKADLSKIAPISCEDYIVKSTLQSILNKISGVKQFVSEKVYSINASGDVYTDGVNSWNFSGAIAIDMTKIFDKIEFNETALESEKQDVKFTDVSFGLRDILVKNLNDGTTYDVDLNYIDDHFFISYADSLRGYLSRTELATLGAYVYGIMNPGKTADDDVVLKMLSMMGANPNVDTGIFDQMVGEGSASSIAMNIDIDHLITRVVDIEGELSVSFNVAQFYELMYGDKVFEDTIVTAHMDSELDENNNNKITTVAFENMYTAPNEKFNFNLDFVREGDTFEDGTAKNLIRVPTIINKSEVTVTNDDGSSYNLISGGSLQFEDGTTISIGTSLGQYYYIGNMANLIEAFINTANLRKFSLSGSINMNIIGIIKLNISITLDVILDSNNAPIIHGYFDVPQFWGTLDGGRTHMIYKDEKIRFRNNNKNFWGQYKDYDYLAYDSLEDMNNNIATMVNYILQSGSLVKKAVEDGIANSQANIDIATFIKGYSYNFDKANSKGNTNITLVGSQLMSTLGDLNVTNLTNEKKTLSQFDNDGNMTSRGGYYLTSFGFNTKMASVIELKGSFALTNEENKDIVITIPQVNGVSILDMDAATANSSKWNY